MRARSIAVILTIAILVMLGQATHGIQGIAASDRMARIGKVDAPTSADAARASLRGMRRAVPVVVAAAMAVAGCAVSRSPRTQPQTVLVTATPLPVAPLLAREAMAWDVFWEGFEIGRVELSVGVTSRATFSTNGFARMLASVRYELVADRTHARERVSAHGKTTEHAIDVGAPAPGGTKLHTTASALAGIRAWAAPGASRTYAWVIVDGGLYRLDLAPPVRERLDRTRALRVDGVIRPLAPNGARAQLSVWLAESADRSPLRFVVDAGGERVVAQLRETSLTAR